MESTNAAGQAAAMARGAERVAAPWIEALARFGYAAKGVVYILMGCIAGRAAWGGGGDVEGTTGAIESLRDEPFGDVLLWLVALGLIGYVVWRAVAAIRDPENDGTGHRVFSAITAVLYAGLALEAVRLATGGGGSEGGAHWTSTLMEQPFGRILVGLAGLATLAYGAQQLWSAWSADLDDRLDLSRLSTSTRRWIVRLARFGLAARGIVLVLLGYMFMRAAVKARASQAGDVEGVLESMRDRPWLLAAIALGFIAYGAYNVVRARYRRIRAA